MLNVSGLKSLGSVPPHSPSPGWERGGVWERDGAAAEVCGGRESKRGRKESRRVSEKQSSILTENAGIIIVIILDKLREFIN